jgi:diguanylate cyclase (GGDEF)-like protein/PAS domain S-box-containing protein
LTKRHAGVASGLLLAMASFPASAADTIGVYAAMGIALVAAAATGGAVALLLRKRSQDRNSAFDKERWRAWATLAALREGVLATDTHGCVVFMNAAAEGLTGWTSAEACGHPLGTVYRVIDEHTRAPVDYFTEGRSGHEPADAVRAPVRLVQRDGTETSIHDSFTPVHAEDGSPMGYAVVFHDVSHLRALSQQLSWQASHDALTGLVNRREFERRLAELLETARTHGRQHVLLYIDLDHFKTVNDTCGHAAGDELLRSLTSVMSSRMRGSDTLARVGGDEFGALLELCPLDQGLRIANAIRETVRDFRFVWEGRSFAVGASIGLVPIDAGSGTAAQVLAAADGCCYDAKSRGRDRVQVLRPSEVSPPATGDQQMIARVSRAFEQGDFRLYQQAILPLRKEGTAARHVEVLVRMRGDGGEMIPPMAFLPEAERYNLLTAIDRWVIGELLRVLRARHTHGAHPLGVEAGLYSVNLSGASINDSSFPTFLRRELASSGVPPGLLCFEVTETTAISNLTKAAEVMHELRSLGCCFALDDFGIGMSSFAYLKYLPVDYLKIDGTFVRDIATDEMDHAIVEAINRIAHILGMQTVAEFVEDEATLGRLRALGVDYAQGYHIARPEPIVAMEHTDGPKKQGGS